MNQIAQNIKQRLSLREPLQEALDITATLADTLSLKKAPDTSDEAKEFLAAEIDKVKKLYPTCTDFEREFPSVAFSIATGVGKTRLMGACIAYLYLAKGIRNFFVLAPNLTIYEKLINDFGNPAYHKYVFNGISEFVYNRPVIITGDNYNQQGSIFREEEIRINIFNISKFNSESTAKKGEPRIKRLSEYLGQSYWDYLSGLNDLVILMDEAHRYHADKSKSAINELRPVLGLEMTATPKDEKGIQFKNVVYEYSLAQALADGKYVKNPAIATRKNFCKDQLTEQEIDNIKLEDAVSVHRQTKNELEIYALNNQVPKVKPFILVACRHIEHAKEVFDKINSDSFFDGDYKGKVLQIDSSTQKDEDVERQFVALEQTNNEIEIVIHVGMLKEGWDVTNLYTIVPLQASISTVLVEQTIGRGLRLPYGGKRTGVANVDKLTVLAHDNYQAVIDAANNPDSVLNRLKLTEMYIDEEVENSKVITSKPVIQQTLEQQQEKINTIPDVKEKQKQQNNLDAKHVVINVISNSDFIKEVRQKVEIHKIDDLAKPEIKRQVIRSIETDLSSNLFKTEIVAEAAAVYETMVTELKNRIIEIPRMDLVQGEITTRFNDFDLDTSTLNYEALEQEIMVLTLKGHDVQTIKVIPGVRENSRNLILIYLLEYPEIDYDSNAELLNKLVQQAIEGIQNNLVDKTKISETIKQFAPAIAEKIYFQMMQHFELQQEEIAPNVLPFSKIEQWNYTSLLNFGHKDYREIVRPKTSVPKYIFCGFEKACHFEYKFDSETEQNFAFVLENDKEVIKWLRPAANQFRIYWDNNSKKYEPDFVVETADKIYLIETKADNYINNDDVQAKKQAAEKYCRYASDYTAQNGGKSWQYVLLSDADVSRINNFRYMIQKAK
jgi:type III restriction enzyme